MQTRRSTTTKATSTIRHILTLRFQSLVWLIPKRKWKWMTLKSFLKSLKYKINFQKLKIAQNTLKTTITITFLTKWTLTSKPLIIWTKNTALSPMRLLYMMRKHIGLNRHKCSIWVRSGKNVAILEHKKQRNYNILNLGLKKSAVGIR